MTSDADQRIENHIEALVAEEHELLQAGERHEGLTPSNTSAWAPSRSSSTVTGICFASAALKEEFGLDPDNTSMRDPGTVEGYEA